MRAWVRPKVPRALRGKERGYGSRFAARLVAAKASSKPIPEFTWPTVEKIRLNKHLLPVLKSMTQAHCSHCDAFPVEGVSNETIDHFQPKTRYPKLCCSWKNLFYACDCCQNHKGESFDGRLLRPDAPDYSFDRFFLYDYASGRIEVNPGASASDQERTKTTIELLGLNLSDRPTPRQRFVRRFGKLSPAEQDAERDDWPYRFALV